VIVAGRWVVHDGRHDQAGAIALRCSEALAALAADDRATPA